MQFTKLVKGKIIDAQPGFVDSWNRMVDCWNNLVGVNAASVNWLDDFHPVVNVQFPSQDSGDESSDDDYDPEEDFPELVLPPFDPVVPAAKTIPRPFEIVGGIVTNCTIPCPIATVTAADYTIAGDDPVYLHIDRGSTSYAATVNQTSRANSATHAQFKLYEFSDGKPTLDCRPTALPLLAF